MIAVIGLIVAIWLVVALTVAASCRRDSRAPADDIGCWWLVMLALYSTLPPLSWLLQGGQYSLLSPRLYAVAPTPDDVKYLLLIAFAYAACFAGTYVPVCRRASPPPVPIRTIPTSHVVAAASIIAVASAATSAVWLFSERSLNYTDTYRVIAAMPLVLRQFLKVAASMGYVAALVVLVSILQHWPRRRWLLLLYIGVILISFDPSGSRSLLALHLFAAAIGWHVLVRPIALRSWLIGGTLGLVAFLAAGILRSISLAQVGSPELAGLGLGEFDNLWANALELLRAAQSGVAVPVTARFAELWAFVPSQLLPFEKQDLSTWFLHTYWQGYSEAGGGFAFGALSQAVIGGGIVEAAVRGALLGVMTGGVFSWFRSARSGWWVFPAYVWLLTDLFQSIRDTTLSPIGDIIQLLIPSLLCIEVLGTVLRLVGRPNHAVPPVADALSTPT